MPSLPCTYELTLEYCFLSKWQHTFSTSRISCRRSSGGGAEAVFVVGAALMAIHWKLHASFLCREGRRSHYTSMLDPPCVIVSVLEHPNEGMVSAYLDILAAVKGMT